MHGQGFLGTLAMVLGVAGLTTLLFGRLKQPLVLGYLLAGMIVGPYVPVPLLADKHTVEQLSELGVTLLMFSIGLEFTLGKLRKVGLGAVFIAVVEVSFMLWLGNLAGGLLGWTGRERLFASAIVAISSTTVIVKAFDELKVDGRLRELALGILVVEDLVAMMLLAALTTIGQGGSAASAMGPVALKLAGFIAGVVVLGLLLVPKLIHAVVHMKRPEVTAVACVGLCFSLALLASAAGFSVALGAFIAGFLVAESGHGEQIDHLLAPVRDLFGAIFFVSVGMLIDPGVIGRNWVAVAVLTAAVLLGKTLAVSMPAFLAGHGVRGSLRAGMSLAQIGEFSFIIAALGVKLGATREFLHAVAVAVAAVTALTTTWFIRWSEPVAAAVDRKLPRPLQSFAALYGSWIERLRAPSAPVERKGYQVKLRWLLLDTLAFGAIVVVTSRFVDRGAAQVASWTGLGLLVSRAAVIGAALLAALPFMVGIVRLVGALGLILANLGMPPPPEGSVDAAAAPRRTFVVALQLAAAAVLGIPLLAATQPFLPRGAPALVLLGVLLLLCVRFWRTALDLHGHVRAGAQVVADALSSGRGADPAQASAAVDTLLPGLGSPVGVVLAEGSPAVGRSLAELALRGRTGATVLAIHRAGANVPLPSGSERLRTGDVLALAGTAEAVAAARALLQRAGP